jgi:hypothetical protein
MPADLDNVHHVYPQGEDYLHEAEDEQCSCQPRTIEVRMSTGLYCVLVLHRKLAMG